MSSFLKLANKNTLKISNAFIVSSVKCSTQAAATNYLQYDKDPCNPFLNQQNQKLLKSMTRLRLDKVYRKKAVLNNKVEYKFMTTEQIENEIKSAFKRAENLLQMPPIVKIQTDNHKIISNDPALKSFDQSKYIFTDITFGIKDTDRTVIVRHPDGVLENASAEVRKRVNQIYFPQQGRQLRQPRLFEPEYMKPCMDALNYEYLLDRACVQYEPYEKEFHNITHEVYLHINENKQFDLLRSTRHFGPMAFFLAWHRLVDDLLIDMIKRDYVQNAVELICLMYRLNGIAFEEKIIQQLEKLSQKREENLAANVLAIGHGELQQDIEKRVGKSAEDFVIDDVCCAFIETFTRSHGIKKAQIDISLQTYRELNEEKRRLLDGLQKAHGI